MNISHLFEGVKTTKRKRVARGIAGAGGKTAGRGTKGQKSRSGSGRKVQAWFEGGQTPLYRKQAKRRGFKRTVEKDVIVTTTLINKFYKSGETVSPTTLIEKGIVRRINRTQSVKVLKRADLGVEVKFDSVKLSKSLAG